MMIRIVSVIVFCLISVITANKTLSDNTVANKTTANLKPCQNATKKFRDQFFLIFICLIFFIGVLGNGFTILIVTASKSLRNQASYIFITSLAVTDLGVAFFTLPIRMSSLYYSGMFCFNEEVCFMHSITDVIFHIASINHLFVIAVERFLAISAPYHYQRMASKKKIFIAVALTWLYSVVWASLGMFPWDSTQYGIKLIVAPNQRHCFNLNNPYYVTVIIVVYLVPLFIMGVLFVSIWHVAVRHAQIIASLNPTKNNNQNKNKPSSKQEVRATKTLSIVYGIFCVCWLPYLILVVSSTIDPEHFIRFQAEHENAYTWILTIFVETLPPLHSCLNPFIYASFNRNFRKSAKFTMHKMCGKLVSDPKVLDATYFSQSENVKKNNNNNIEMKTQQDNKLHVPSKNLTTSITLIENKMAVESTSL